MRRKARTPKTSPGAGAFLPWSNRDYRSRKAPEQVGYACIPNRAKMFYGGCSGKPRLREKQVRIKQTSDIDWYRSAYLHTQTDP